MSKVLCILPRAGLANQLFLIASSELYANKYNLTVGYRNQWQFKIGPFLRQEKNKRNYLGFFKFQKITFKNILLNFLSNRKTATVCDPKLSFNPNKVSLVVYESLPHWTSYFDEYIPHRGLVRELIYNQLSSKIQQNIETLPIIDVAIHVRLGDFQKLKVGTDFKNVGTTRTPLDYFLKEIEQIKKVYPDYTFYVFTDGYPDEVSQLTKISNVELYNSKNDIVDLYQMSKSKILITSAGSTYSYWAGFLGDCEVIQHPDHFCKLR